MNYVELNGKSFRFFGAIGGYTNRGISVDRQLKQRIQSFERRRRDPRLADQVRPRVVLYPDRFSDEHPHHAAAGCSLASPAFHGPLERVVRTETRFEAGGTAGEFHYQNALPYLKINVTIVLNNITMPLISRKGHKCDFLDC